MSCPICQAHCLAFLTFALQLRFCIYALSRVSSAVLPRSTAPVSSQSLKLAELWGRNPSAENKKEARRNKCLLGNSPQSSRITNERDSLGSRRKEERWESTSPELSRGCTRGSRRRSRTFIDPRIAPTPLRLGVERGNRENSVFVAVA